MHSIPDNICPKCLCNIKEEKKEMQDLEVTKRLLDIEIARLKAVKKLDNKNKER